MSFWLHAFHARFLILSIVFLVSACVIGTSATDELVKEKAAPTVAPVAKAAKVEKTVVTHVKSTSKTQRYVNVDSLNVRSGPSVTAPIVAKLTRGTMFAVTVKGDWAEIAPGQFVLLKHMSAVEPKAQRRVVAKR